MDREAGSGSRCDGQLDDMSSRVRLRQGQSCRPSAALWVVLLGLPALCLAANPAELLQSCLSDQQAAAPGANFKAFLQGQHPR